MSIIFFHDNVAAVEFFKNRHVVLEMRSQSRFGIDFLFAACSSGC